MSNDTTYSVIVTIDDVTRRIYSDTREIALRFASKMICSCRSLAIMGCSYGVCVECPDGELIFERDIPEFYYVGE